MASKQNTGANTSEPTSGPSHQSETVNAIFPDGGWGWAVVFVSTIMSVIGDGVRFGSFGLLYVEFLSEFGASKAYTGAIGSIFIAMPLLSGPLMSAFIDRYGCRNVTILGGLTGGIGFTVSAFAPNIECLFFTFGVVAGLGIGMCFVTAVVGVTVWFDKRLALATGLAAAGSGIGTFLFAPMTSYFIELYGWRGAVLLLGGCLLNWCVCGLVMIDPPWLAKQKKLAKVKAAEAKAERAAYRGEHMKASLKKGNVVSSSRSLLNVQMFSTTSLHGKSKWYEPLWNLMKDVFDLSIFLESHFLLFQISKIVFYIWFIVPYFCVAEHMLRNGYRDDQAPTMLCSIGVWNTVGLVVLGWIGDRHWFDIKKCYAFLLFVCGCSVLVIPFVTHMYYLLLTFTSIFGFCYASVYTFTPVIVVEMASIDRFANAYGLTLMCEGIGNLVGPALAGWVFDITGTWDMSFYASGIFILISGFLVVILTLTKNRKFCASSVT